jgi:hypothetical protein
METLSNTSLTTLNRLRLDMRELVERYPNGEGYGAWAERARVKVNDCW